jgi:hypothetical protein
MAINEKSSVLCEEKDFWWPSFIRLEAKEHVARDVKDMPAFHASFVFLLCAPGGGKEQSEQAVNAGR